MEVFMATPKLESNGKTWGITASYTDSRGAYRRKYKGGFTTQAKAKKWATNYAIEMAKTSLVDQNIKICTVIEKLLYEKEYVEKRAQSTMHFYEENFDIIEERFGACHPNKVNVLQIQDFVNSFVDTPRKCKAIYQCISILFNYMERLDLIDRNPIKKVVCPDYEPKETKHYDLETFKLLLDKLLTVDDCIYTPVLIMGTLGLRPSETLALTDNDIQENYLSVSKASVTVKRKGKKQEAYIGKTKTEKSTRGFMLDNGFTEKLYSYRRRHNIVSPFLCVQKDGSPITYTVLKKHLKSITQKNNLHAITPYGLRHTFAQIQKALGTDVYTISRLMGHSNTTITSKTYFHNDKTLNQNAIQRITDLI